MTASSIAVAATDATHADPPAESNSRPNFLRVLTAGEAPHHEQLTPGRISIGSSPRCTIRVAGPGVQPLHCTLQIDEQGARCKSWGGDVRHNGETFRSTILKAGDVLQVGVVRLVAVEQPDDPVDEEQIAHTWAGPHPGCRHGGDATRAPLLEQPVLAGVDLDRRMFTDRLVYDLARSNQTARARLRRCLASLRSTRREAAATARNVADLENRLGESWKEQSQQRELCERLQQEAAKAADAAEALQQIDALSSQLGEVEAELATTQLELAERTAAHQALEQRNAELESSLALHSKTAERIEALEDRFREAQRLSESREQQLTALQEERNRLQAQLEELQTEAAEQRDQAERLALELGEAEKQDHETIAAATARCRELTDQAEQTAKRLDEVAAESQRRADELQELKQQQRAWETERLAMETRLAEQASRIAALTVEQAQAAEEPDPREEQLAEAEEQRRDLELQLAASREEAAEAERRSQELEARADELREQLQQAEAQLAAVETQLGEAESQAQHARSQLNQVQQDDEADGQQLADALARVESLAEEAATLAEELESVRRENERLATAAAEAQEAAAALQSAVVAEPASVSDDAPLETGEAFAAAEPASDMAQDDAAEEVEEEDSAPYTQPTSFFEQYKHLLPDDNDPGEAPGPAVVQEPTRPPLLSSGDDEDSESLEQYMAEMMQRVRTSAPAATASFAPTPPAPKARPVRPSVEAHEPVDAEGVAVEPIDLEELRSTSQKPPLATDLVALRSLANSAARKAIATSHQRRDLEVLASKLFICVIAVAASTYLVATGETWQSPATIAGVGIALAGAYAGFQFGGRLIQIWKVRRAASEEASNAEADSAATDPPGEAPAAGEATE